MASVASLDMIVTSTDISIDFCVSGYAQKVSQLFEIGLRYLFEQNEKLFSNEVISRQLEMLEKEYRNRGLTAGGAAKSARLCALKADRYCSEELLASLLSVSESVETAKGALRSFLDSFLSRACLECLVQGNFSTSAATDLVSMMRAATARGSLSKTNYPEQLILTLPKKQKHMVLNVAPKNPDEENVALEVCTLFHEQCTYTYFYLR